MNEQKFTFTYEPNAENTARVMRTQGDTGLPPVKGQGWATVLKILQCGLMGLGAWGFGLALEYLVSGQLRVTLWTFFTGILLFYIAVFGTFIVTIPVMARRAMGTRVNQGPLTLTFDASGMRSQSEFFESKVAWGGIDAVTRNKTNFVLWVGGNRPSLPFDAMNGPEEIDAFERAINRWLEDSR